jgi:hypothetical protein
MEPVVCSCVTPVVQISLSCFKKASKGITKDTRGGCAQPASASQEVQIKIWRIPVSFEVIINRTLFIKWLFLCQPYSEWKSFIDRLFETKAAAPEEPERPLGLPLHEPGRDIGPGIICHRPFTVP